MVKRIIPLIKNSAGVTFIELMVGAGILGLAVVMYMGASNFFLKKNKETLEGVVLSNYVNAIYNSMQSNLDLYQITYDSKSFHENTSPEFLRKNLPMAWDFKTITKVSECEECPGRLGYIVEPVSGYRGLYKLTVRATHPNIQGFRDYKLLLIGK